MVTLPWKLNRTISNLICLHLCFLAAQSISILWRKVFHVCARIKFINFYINNVLYSFLNNSSIAVFPVCWFSSLRKYFTHKQNIHLSEKQLSWDIWHVDNSDFHTDYVQLMVSLSFVCFWWFFPPSMAKFHKFTAAGSCAWILFTYFAIDWKLVNSNFCGFYVSLY